MSFFEDIGRSNLLGHVTQAIQGMGALQDMQVQEQAIKSEGMKQKKLQYEAEEVEKQKKFNSAYVPVSSFDPEYKQNTEDSALLFKTLKSMGHDVREEGGEVFITNEAKAAISKMQRQDVEFTANRIEAKLKDVSSRLQQTGGQLFELEQAGKGPGDKNYDALKMQEEVLKKRLSLGITSQQSYQEKLLLEIEKMNDFIKKQAVIAQLKQDEMSNEEKQILGRERLVKQFGPESIQVKTYDEKIRPKEGQNQTEEQLTARALRGDKEAQQILDAMQKRKLEIAKQTKTDAAKINLTYAVPKGGAGTDALSKDSATLEGSKYLLTGKLPFMGMGGKGRIEMVNEASRITKENGWTPQMVLRMQADYRGMDKSVANQRKNYDMMNGFVINMDKQMERLETAYKQLPRSQYKLLNIPLVELRTRAVGSGEEAATKAILIELANESGKLSTNSAASIQELSQSAQKQWADIHDNKLSFNEIRKVLATTKNLGHDRIESTKKAMQFTLDGIEGLGNSPALPSPPKQSSVEVVAKKKQWLDAARKANPKASDKELTDYYDKKYGGQ